MYWGEPDWSGPGYGAITAFVNTDVNVKNPTDGKVKIKFALEQAMKAHRGSRCIALLFL
jgi:hypothetical protein